MLWKSRLPCEVFAPPTLVDAAGHDKIIRPKFWSGGAARLSLKRRLECNAALRGGIVVGPASGHAFVFGARRIFFIRGGLMPVLSRGAGEPRHGDSA